MTNKDATIQIDIEHYGRLRARLALPPPAECADLDYPALARQALDHFDRERRPGYVPMQINHVEDAIREGVEEYLAGLERASDVIAEVGDSDSGVGCVAWVVYAATGRPVPREADEGGDHHGGGSYPHWAAAREAEDRARRTGRPIRRVGYSPSDLTPRR